MRCELIAVGTELLLGQVVDTNSAWLAERLAAAGVDCHAHTTVGDNHARIVEGLRSALTRADAVIISGGLGPTADDITREALAEVAGVPLVRDESLAERIEEIFVGRGREMAPSNLRQADVPRGATVIAQRRGTAPGLIVAVGAGVVYALPGVPHELQEMALRAVVPDLVARAQAGGEGATTIVSRMVRTWGLSESLLAERVAPRLAWLDAEGSATLAFLAQGMEGTCVRITARAPTPVDASVVLDREEKELRSLLGDAVFATDDQTMEHAVAAALRAGGLSLGLAESLTGGLVASRLVEVEGSSGWFRGSVVAYDSQVKFDLLGVPEGPVVSVEAAAAMAEGAARVLGGDVGLSLTGVAGPATQEGMAVGTVFVGCTVGSVTEVARLSLPGDRRRVRHYAAISALDFLRRRLARSAR
ncbi:MAG: competence/damage-inducible protein A [Acidimicrobiales bacterium]